MQALSVIHALSPSKQKPQPEAMALTRRGEDQDQVKEDEELRKQGMRKTLAGTYRPGQGPLIPALLQIIQTWKRRSQ